MNRLIWAFLIATRLRDRLRCPSCSAVGTYKLHEPAKNANGSDVPWRWLCKWCGYYCDQNKSGMLCYPSAKLKCWAFFGDANDDRRTPQDWLRESLPNCWPWRG